MKPERLADGVEKLTLTPRHGINAYVLGDVLVDAGYGLHGKPITEALRGRELAGHALTHAHPDHAGGSAHVARELGLEVWAHELDVQAAESGRAPMPNPLMAAYARFKGVPIARRLREGDAIGGFEVLHVPGHSAGHLAFWRESDRVLVGGDVFFNLSPFTLRHGLRNPPGLFTPDPERNRISQRRLADLDPELVLLGHGPPIRGRGKLAAFLSGR